KVDQKTSETCRMLIHNRLPNLCFTRDRLIFLDLQQAAARRAKWEHQDFSFEAAYYLNFYYMLLFGGFDHLALMVNGVLGVGLPEKSVGAGYKDFLKALEAKDARIHALFTNPEVIEFIKTIAALRHFAAHRGSITPAKIYTR